MNSPFQETLQRRQDVLLYLPKIHSSLFNFHRKYKKGAVAEIKLPLVKNTNNFLTKNLSKIVNNNNLKKNANV